MAKKNATKTNQEQEVVEKTTVTKRETKKASKVEAAPKTVEEDIIVEETEETEDTVEEDGADKTTRKRVVPTRDSVLANFDEIIESIEKEIEQLRDSTNKTKGVKFLRTLGKKLKGLKAHSTRLMSKRSTTQRKIATSTTSGFLKPVPISKDIAKFAGWDVKELRSRVQVTKALCDYIKEHNLQNEKDKRQILPDNKLCKLLNFDPKTSTQPLTYFHLQRLLKSHFPKTTGVTA